MRIDGPPVVIAPTLTLLSLLTCAAVSASGVVGITNNTASTSTTTGALTIAGGLGVAGAGFFGGTVTVADGNASSPGLRLTNANTGLYSSATTFLGFSVNGTAAASLTSAGVFTLPAVTGATLVINSTSTSQSAVASNSAYTLGGFGAAGPILSTSNILTNAEDTYMGSDALSVPRLGFVKKTGLAPKLCYGNGISFAIATSNAANIAAASTFTDRLTISATGVVSITNTTASTSTTTGALTIAGGLGVAGAGFFGGALSCTTLTATSGATLTGPDVFSLGLIARRSSADTAVGNYPCAVFANSDTTNNNGVGLFFRCADTGGTERTAAGFHVTGTNKTASVVEGIFAIYTRTSSGYGERFKIDTAGVVSVPNATASTSTTTGALTIAGGLGVVGAGYFGGNLYSPRHVSSTADAALQAQFVTTSGQLQIYGYYDSTFGAILNAYNVGASAFVPMSLQASVVRITQGTTATSTTTGALTVAGGVGIAGALFTGGAITSELSNAGAVNVVLARNTSSGTGAQTRIACGNDGTAQGSIYAFSSTYAGTTYGLSSANLIVFGTAGTTASALVFGATTDIPVVIGQNLIERMRFTSSLATLSLPLTVTGDVTRSGSSTAQIEYLIQNTGTGTTSRSRYRVLNANNDAVATFSMYNLSNTQSTYGFSLGNWAALECGSANVNGLVIGCASIDKPIVFGINASEVGRITGGTLSTGRFDIKYTTASTSTTTGALTVAGGVGVGGEVTTGGLITGGRATTIGTAIFASATTPLSGAVTDSFASGFGSTPILSGAFAVTRHNYINLNDVSLLSGATLTDACVFRFNANAGTHKAVDGSTTKTTPGGVDAWMKVNVNGTIYYSPLYLSKTA